MKEHSKSLYNFEVVLKDESVKKFIDTLGALHDNLEQYEAQVTTLIQTIDGVLQDEENHVSEESREQLEEEINLITDEKLFELQQSSDDIRKLVDLIIENDNTGFIELY